MGSDFIHNKNYLPHVDGLRGIAVVAVLLFHLDVSGFSGGFTGVDIFLVISGFLITNLIKKEIETTSKFDFKRFYIRRVRRLAPALLFTLFLATGVAVLIFSPGALKRYGEELIASILSVSNIYFWIEADYFDVEAYSRPLLHTWSLSLEEQFYLIWPLFLVVFLRRVRGFWILFSLLLIIFISLGLNLLFSNGIKFRFNNIFFNALENGESTIFYLLPFRVFEFCIGSCLAWTANKNAKKLTADIFLVIGIIILIISIHFLSKKNIFPSYNALLPCFGAALVIQFGSASRLKWLLENKALVTIGLLSYSLYLVHWPLVVFTQYRFGAINETQQISLALISLGLAWMSWRFIETPFRSKVVSIKWLLLPAPVLVVAGAAFIFGNGLSWRVADPVIFAQIESPKEFHTEYYGGQGYPYNGPVGSEEPPDILLIGDSHARHYAEGLYKEIAEPYGYKLYIIAGTSFIHLPNFTRTTPGMNWDLISKDTMRQIQEMFLKYNNKPLVIMSHAWTFQMSNAALVDDMGNRFQTKPNISDIYEGIHRLKKNLDLERLVVIGELPGTNGINIYEQMTRPYLGRKNTQSDLQYTDPLGTNCVGINYLFKKFENEGKLFVFIDPSDSLLHNNKFKNFDPQGMPLYSDPTHLSKFGSRYVIKKNAQQILKLLQSCRATFD
jgi:peptidoglycan/LPS O-acetylase OafA/YrhL